MVSATLPHPQRAAAGAAAVRLPVPDYHNHPVRSLVVVFGLWKAFLLGLAVLATLAGPAYDTSGGLFSAGGNNSPGGVADGLVARLTSWDAIFYVEAARHGYRYEQEWAFGSGLPLVVASLRRALVFIGLAPPSAAAAALTEPVLAIAVAHAAHLLAVLLLYRLVRTLSRQLRGHSDCDRHGRIAFVAACLHVLSPAGLFLSAPYSESGNALFTFAGYLVYATTLGSPSSPLRLLSGTLFGVATVFRSNGLLNGLVFAYDAVAAAWALLQAVVAVVRGHQPRPKRTLRQPLLAGLVAGLGGLAVAAGSVGPQTVAYMQFCRTPSTVPGEDVRPWCHNTVPSIYAFVQERYWNTGLFRYWALSNLPLFLLATPMLLVLTWSSLDAWTDAPAAVSKSEGVQTAKRAKTKTNESTTATTTAAATAAVALIRCMAVSQLLLAALVLTSYHVQIITRLSSGCPLWYAWLAVSLTHGRRAYMAGHIVVFMVIYASVQGVLFASFLPPA